MKRYVASGLLCFPVVLLMALSSLAQSPASPQDADAPLKLRAELVTLEAQVTKKKMAKWSTA